MRNLPDEWSRSSAHLLVICSSIQQLYSNLATVDRNSLCGGIGGGVTLRP
jgi:hypothetical protein